MFLLRFYASKCTNTWLVWLRVSDVPSRFKQKAVRDFVRQLWRCCTFLLHLCLCRSVLSGVALLSFCIFEWRQPEVYEYLKIHKSTQTHNKNQECFIYKGSEVFTGSTKSSSPLRTRHKYVHPHHEEVFSFNFLFRSIHVNIAFSTHKIVLVWSGMTFGAFMSVQKKKKKNHENYDYETWCNQHESKIR